MIEVLLELAEAISKRDAVVLLAKYLDQQPEHPNKDYWKADLRRAYSSLNRRVETLTSRLYYGVIYHGTA